jgi:hypothetical protein
MQVSLLKMNAGISRAVETSTTFERSNAALETSIARLGSQERIRSAAVAQGMVSPPAGSVGYLTARPSIDPARASRRMQPPSDEARQLMAAGGLQQPVAGTVSVQATQPAPAQPLQQVPAASGTG